ncbi:hypothetical protein [Novosphingobium terrae]|uniref:hypothetical protein n=1 Tax=Novosphingobium terrae TaxID=2726189 RepID=UPI001981B435|nr:hypothetical protein [Novosphingobium terrae]
MLALLPFLLAAAAAPDLTGSWDLDAGGATIFRLEIAAAPDGPSVTWIRPTTFDSDGDSFSGVSGPVVSLKAHDIRSVNGDLDITVDDPHPGAGANVLRLHRVDATHIDVSYRGLGIGLEPFHFARSQPHPAALGPWDSKHTYALTFVRKTNPEMTAIFKADQDDRTLYLAGKMEGDAVWLADQKRYKRTQELLDAGQLSSAEDYNGAAFVFQHGSKPEDFLKAHLLAMVAVARGMPSAIWIAGATLDRYLQSINQPQVLGTQFLKVDGPEATQDPYNRSVISDAVRQALKVPPVAEQQEQLQHYRDEAAKAASKSNPQSSAKH